LNYGASCAYFNFWFIFLPYTSTWWFTFINNYFDFAVFKLKVTALIGVCVSVLCSSPHYLWNCNSLSFCLYNLYFSIAYTAMIHLAKSIFDIVEGYIRQFCGCYWWIKSNNLATFCFCGNISSPGLAWFSCFEQIITIWFRLAFCTFLFVHSWYRRKFEDYPSSRFAIIPFCGHRKKKNLNNKKDKKMKVKHSEESKQIHALENIDAGNEG
jgi:hypothetical protein